MHRRFRPFFVILLAAWVLAAEPARAQFLILAQGEETITELANGSSLTLDSEGAGATVSTNISIRFVGPESSTATVNPPSLSGSTTFRLTTAAELPHLLRPGQDLDLRVTFTPSGTGPFSARLTLNLTQNDLGRPARTSEVLINLNGRAAGYTTSFKLPGGNEILLPPDGVVEFPDTEMSGSTAATITVTNRGTGPGTITAVQVDGGGAFEVSGLQLLPLIVQPGGSLSFSVIFSPLEPRTFAGSLRISFGAGSRSVQLVGTEAGASLVYETVIGTATSTVLPGETIALDLTHTETGVLVRVANTGASERAVNSIGVSGAAFRVADLPLLPFTLGAGESVTFRLEFNPTQRGTAAGELLINAASFPLLGSVPPLAGVTIAEGDRTVEPAAQLPVSVTLIEPYMVDLAGDLILTFTSSAFSNDPAIQFSTGGRSAKFLIPAGETEARFASGERTILMQTGTVAGTIILEAFVDAASAGVEVTPAPRPATTLSVPRAAPRLRKLDLAGVSQSGLTLEITGFATSRAVTNLELQFTGVPGSNLQTTSLQANVSGTFNTWYQSAQSVNFGSQFTATVNLVVDGDANAIQSISVRAVNESGGSESLSLSVQ